jgi:hypothetical protein
MVQRLILRNFRSFKEVDMELRPLNIVVGANASGKTNLVQAFRFLRDIARHGLENAVALQGGAEYLTNLNSPSARECHIEIVFTPQLDPSSCLQRAFAAGYVKVDEVRHSLTIQTPYERLNSAKIVRGATGEYDMHRIRSGHSEPASSHAEGRHGAHVEAIISHTA